VSESALVIESALSDTAGVTDAAYGGTATDAEATLHGGPQKLHRPPDVSHLQVP